MRQHAELRHGRLFAGLADTAITSLDVAYTGEQWRLGTAGRPDRLDFQYSLDATSLTTGTWTDVDALDYSTTDTTGTAVVPVLNLNGLYSVNASAPMNMLNAATRPISSDGSLLVFESAGNYTNNNADKTRELWLYNVNTKAYTQITSQSASTTPTQDELKKIDYNFLPSVNSTGTHISFGSTLNLTPATTSGVKTDNADGSREVFRYETN